MWNLLCPIKKESIFDASIYSYTYSNDVVNLNNVTHIGKGKISVADCCCIAFVIEFNLINGDKIHWYFNNEKERDREFDNIVA